MNTRLEVTSLRKCRPDLTLQEIGNIVGCSRQNVWEILKKGNLPTKNSEFYRHFCKVCGTIINKNRVYCEKCHPVRKISIIKCDCGCEETFLRETKIIIIKNIKNYKHCFKNRDHFYKWERTHNCLSNVLRKVE